MNISIIITFFQGINILKLCLSNIIQNTPLNTYEIIIVNDNPNTDLDIIKKEFDNVCEISVFNMPHNMGYAAACNTGVKLAKYQHIILMDCDIFPHKDWLKELIATYHNEINPGAVSAKIIEADSNKLFGFGIGVYGVDIILYKRHGNLDSFSEADRQFPMISSGCMLIDKNLYLQLGGQDENFLNADNDLDLTYRIHLSGKTNVISAKSIVYHRGHISGNIRILPFRQDSKAWLFRKWGDSINTQTMNVLRELYSTFPKKDISKNVILVSFSNSLVRSDYIQTIVASLDINYIQKFDFKNIDLKNSIFIHDYLSWDICRTNISILYFVDDYRLLSDNSYWFKNRVCNDAIFDKNGNSLLVTSKNNINKVDRV